MSSQPPQQNPAPPEQEPRPRGALHTLFRTMTTRPHRLPSIPPSLTSSALASPSLSYPTTPSSSPSPFGNTARFPPLTASQPTTSISGPLKTTSIEECINVLTPPFFESLTPQNHYEYAQTFLAVLGNPAFTSTTLSASSLTPIVSALCLSNASRLRNAGYNILAAYFSSLSYANTIKNMDRAAFWAVMRESSDDDNEWDARATALLKLTREAHEVEGLEGLVVSVGGWAETAAGRLAYTNNRQEMENRLASSLKFLTELLKHNAATLTPQEVSMLIQIFDRILNAALRVPPVSIAPPNAPRESSFDIAPPLVSSPIPYGTPSRSTSTSRVTQTQSPLNHRRHPSSQSSTPFVPSPPTPSTPSTGLPQFVQPLYTVPAQLYLAHVLQTIESTVITSADLEQIVTTLTLSLSYNLSPLPALSAASRHHSSQLEVSTSQVLRTLLSNTYMLSTARLLKRLLHPPKTTSLIAVRCAEGAARTIRLSLRLAAESRLAANWFSREDDTRVLENAWNQSGNNTQGAWEVSKVVDVLGAPIKEWVDKAGSDGQREEKIISECMGIAVDIVDEAGIDGRSLTHDEGRVVGEVLAAAVLCVGNYRGVDGQPLRLQMHPPIHVGPSPPSLVLELLTGLIPRIPLTSALEPPLPKSLMLISPNLTDSTSVALIEHHVAQHDILPLTSDWVSTLSTLFSSLYLPGRPRSRQLLVQTVKNLYDTVRDVKTYRDPLFSLCLEVWERSLTNEDLGDVLSDALYVLGDGIVALAGELTPTEIEQPNLVERTRHLLCRIARQADPQSPGWDSTLPPPFSSASSSDGVGAMSTPSNTPVVTPLPSERDSQSYQPLPLMALVNGSLLARDSPPALSRRTTGASSGILSPTPLEVPPPRLRPIRSRSMWAVLTLIAVFSRLAFSPPHCLISSKSTARAPASFLCVLVYRDLLSLLSPTDLTPLDAKDPRNEERSKDPDRAQAACPTARLAILQWLVRLRADRGHRLYIRKELDADVQPYAEIARRMKSDDQEETHNFVVASPVVEDRDWGYGRTRSKTNRGDSSVEPGRNRGRAVSRVGRDASRSRSRGPPPSLPPKPNVAQKSLWSIPEVVPFDVTIGTRPSEGMTTFTDTSAPSDGVASQLWLPTSSYVCVIADLLADETDWEILSYILCHIPIQFANKHLLCGPRTRPIIQRLAETICNLLLSNQLAKKIVRTTSFPGMGEVQAVTYLALTTLMSYHTTFNVELKHALVKAFHMGLVGRYQTTIKPCLQALSIAAYELQPSMTRNLSEILDSMTRCVFNSNVTVHILELLSIFSTVPGLYANFTQAQYKLVFAIALKYIQHHNHSTAAGSWGPKESHALSQHVIGIAYYVIYCWFLAIKITDRRKHVPYISEQLLKANAGDSEIDPRSEVAFDWLARYTYADARPRPSQSFLREAVVGNPPEVVKEKTWLFRTSLVTIRALKRPGWFEIESRRPTGHTRFLCLLENLPLDLLEQLDDLVGDQSSVRDENPSGSSPTPDEDAVVVDPSFMALMLSGYPALSPVIKGRLVTDEQGLASALRSLDFSPVVDLHKMAVLYVGPDQTTERQILGNRHGSPSYTRFLANIAPLISLKNPPAQIYHQGLDFNTGRDGEYAYMYFDDIIQIAFHVATMMPNPPHDTNFTMKKSHLGNIHVRVVWNDSGLPYAFDTLKTDFQFVNIVIEPHSVGAMAAYSNSVHEHDFFRVTCQRVAGMPEFGPIGTFKLISAANLPVFIRQVGLLADFFTQIYTQTAGDTIKYDHITNWRTRLIYIQNVRKRLQPLEPEVEAKLVKILSEPASRDFTGQF